MSKELMILFMERANGDFCGESQWSLFWLEEPMESIAEGAYGAPSEVSDKMMEPVGSNDIFIITQTSLTQIKLKSTLMSNPFYTGNEIIISFVNN